MRATSHTPCLSVYYLNYVIRISQLCWVSGSAYGLDIIQSTQHMLTEIYIDAMPIDGDLADLVREACYMGETDDQSARVA